MKRVFITLFFLLCLNLNTQVKPLNRNAGRVVYLKLIAFTHDESGNKFIFKRPSSILPLEDASFFLIDNKQVIKFGKDGEFLDIIVKRGQGPGEATYLSQLYLRNKELVVNTGVMEKLMFFDLNGNLIKEHKRRNNMKKTIKGYSIGESSVRIIGSTKDSDFIVFDYSSSGRKKNTKNNEYRQSVLLLSEENVLKKQLFEIPFKSFVYKTSFGENALPLVSFRSASDADYIYYCYSDQYEIQVYSIDKNKIESSWKREYTSVKIPKTDRDKYKFGMIGVAYSKGKNYTYQPPPRETFPDIQKLFIVNNYLWVITSTVDKEKGVLVDVFDRKGRYFDHFYLSLPEKVDCHALKHICINGDHVYIREIDEEDNYMIGKYKIIDP